MKKQHIVFSLESFFPYSNGGTENSVIQLTQYLTNRGYQVTILVPDNNGKRTASIFQNVNIKHFSSPIIFSKSENFGLVKPSNLEAFRNTIEKLKPDIFHLQSFSPALNSYHLKMAKELGIITVFTPRLASNFCINNGELVQRGKYVCDARVSNNKCLSCNLIRYGIKTSAKARLFSLIIGILSFINYYPGKISPYYFRASAKKKELKRTVKYTDAVVSISDWVTNAFQVNCFNNIAEIIQGIDYSIRNNKQKPNYPVVFTFIGRFSTEKGIDKLISILNNFNNYGFILNIITIEQNVDKTYLEKVMNDCKFAKKINLTYNLSTEQVYNVLENTHWLCLLSNIRDTAPRVIHEAFACQVPAIVSQHISDFVEHNVNGIRINIDNEEETVSIFKMILKDFSTWSRLKAGIKPPRNINQVGKEHELLYLQLMNSSNG